MHFCSFLLPRFELLLLVEWCWFCMWSCQYLLTICADLEAVHPPKCPSCTRIPAPQVRLDAAGVGVSVVDPKQELLYASATGIRARCTASSGRLTVELAVKVRAPCELLLQ